MLRHATLRKAEGKGVGCILPIISQPVTKVYPLDVKLAKFLASSSAGHEEIKQSIFNIAMTPVLSFNVGD